jgi:hypothetical protein
MNVSLLRVLDRIITVSNRLASTVKETARYYDVESHEHVITFEYRSGFWLIRQYRACGKRVPCLTPYFARKTSGCVSCSGSGIRNLDTLTAFCCSAVAALSPSRSIRDSSLNSCVA